MLMFPVQSPANKPIASSFVCSCLKTHLMMEVVLSRGAPTPAGTSVFTKHNWDMGMGYSKLSLNGRSE